ncbi:MAG: hypothetical protein WCK05_14920, partial [Planctomycetota bacterium]
MSEELTESTRQVLTTLVAQHGLGRVLEGRQDVCQANNMAACNSQYDECDGPGLAKKDILTMYWRWAGRATEILAIKV